MTKQKHTGLLPCPFCGGKAKLLELELNESSLYRHITCNNCSADVLGCGDDAEEAIENVVEDWNTRAPNTLQAERDELVTLLREYSEQPDDPTREGLPQRKLWAKAYDLLSRIDSKGGE